MRGIKTLESGKQTEEWKVVTDKGMLKLKCCSHQDAHTSKRVRTSEPGKAQKLEALYTSDGRGKVVFQGN